MLTAIVSDLHAGTRSGADVVRSPEPRRRLLAALAAADRVVALGDLLELRERRAATVLDATGSFLEELGEATAGKQLVIVPGNHDHALVGPALDRARLRGAVPLEPASTFPPEDSELAAEISRRMPRTDVVLAYPGIHLRDDVYATHGHYLDLHLTVPRIESIVTSAAARFTGTALDGAVVTPEAYEAALEPVYAFAYAVAQNSEARAVTRGSRLSRRVWGMSSPDGRRGPAGLAVGVVALPLAVAALNALGIGPFRADISGAELRRAGLRALATVVKSLGVEAGHVIFGHTHRPGPLQGEEAEWLMPGGIRLTNTGSWLHEPVFVDGDGPLSPYWPGTVVLLRDEGPPEITNMLKDVDLPPARS